MIRIMKRTHKTREEQEMERLNAALLDSFEAQAYLYEQSLAAEKRAELAETIALDAAEGVVNLFEMIIGGK